MSKQHSSLPLPLSDLRKYYKGKRIAVAGGAGFVGVQLVGLLSEFVGSEGSVVVLDNFSRGRNVVEEDNVYYAFPSNYGDYYPTRLDHAQKTARWIKFHNVSGVDVATPTKYDYLLDGVDVFFNLAAAVAGVLHNENHHLQMYDDNIRVLTGPLRACETAGVPVFFQTSSVCVYAEDHQSPCYEPDGWGFLPHPANAGYAEAKRDGERAAEWANIDRVVIGRPSNIIGPYDYFDEKAHVLPAFIHRSVTTNGIFEAYGSAVVQREFIFSWDVALGMAWAAAFGGDREKYNIGTSGENVITMLSLASMVNGVVAQVYDGKDPNRRIIFNGTKGGGDEKRFSEAAKLQNLGWKHSVSLYDAIHMAVDEYIHRSDMQLSWEGPNHLARFTGNV